jgi:hypothetical protein
LDKDFIAAAKVLQFIYAGLVIIDKGGGIIRLVHYTTQEFFLQTTIFPKAHLQITKICITYLSFDVFDSGLCSTDEEFEERLGSNPFFRYAAQNWGQHARETRTSYQGLINFLSSEGHIGAASQCLLAEKLWSDDQGYSQRVLKQMTGLHLAAYFGIQEAVHSLGQYWQHVDLEDSKGRTPLS